MKRTKRTKATGILGKVFEPRPLSAQKQRVLNEAERIRFQCSSAGRVKAALKEIRSYVVESNHSIPKKIENLKADLVRVQDPGIKRALEKAIFELEHW